MGDSGFMDQFVTHEIVQNKFGPWTKSAAQINASREGKDTHTRSSPFNTIFTGFVDDRLESQSSRFQLASHVVCHAMPSLLQPVPVSCVFFFTFFMTYSSKISFGPPFSGRGASVDQNGPRTKP